MSDFSKYNLTPSLKSCLKKSQKVASEFGHLKVIDIHLVYSLLHYSHNTIDFAFEINGCIKEGFVQTLEIVLDRYREHKRKHKIYSPEIYDILDYAKKISDKNKDEFVGLDHVLVAVLIRRELLTDFFAGLNVDVDALIATLMHAIRDGINEAVATSTKTPQPQTQTKTKTDISDWCENFNEKIKKRGTYEIFGREKETQRAFEVLLRKNKSNIILVGDAGVGKTAVVEGLVEQILQNKCPKLLKNKKILSLDMTSVLAGTMYRGQMEEKVKTIIDEISNSDEYVLFIDEIHTIVGAGNSEGGLDLANSLKPVLSRGGFACIGATTTEEYEKYFKGDSALNRRFEKIDIIEPTTEETLKLISKAKASYEKFHNVKFAPYILAEIIELSKEFLPTKKFPDKAFDIMDEAGAKTKIQNDSDKPCSVKKHTIHEIFAQKLNTSVENIKNKHNIILPGRIGF